MSPLAEPVDEKGGIAQVGLLVAVLLPLVFVPVVAGAFWIPKFALLPTTALLGLAVLVILVRTSARAPAVLAIAFAIWASVTTLTARNQAMAFWGAWFWGTGLLFTLALPGAWAIGLAAGRRGTALIERALLGTVLVNAVVAITETTVNLDPLGITRVGDRSVGLFGNPVYLGAFLAAGAWLSCSVLPPTSWPGVTSLLLIGAGLRASGTPTAIVLLPAVVAMVAVRSRWASALAAGVVLAVGVGIGSGLLAVSHLTSAEARAGSQLVESMRPRLEMWTSALHAVAHHPLFGAGPGRFQSATTPLRTLRFARTGDLVFDDAHNIVVEYATTTGLPGVILLIGWLALSFRRVSVFSALGGFALLGLAGHVLEPQNAALTPLVFLALGAAAPVPEPVRLAKPVGGAIGVVGALSAAWLLVGAGLLQSGTSRSDAASASRSATILPPWPDVDEMTAQLTSASTSGRSAVATTVAARKWVQRALDDDRQNPNNWLLLGTYDTVLGRQAEARQELRTALRLEPWTPEILNTLGALEASSGNRPAARQWFRDSLHVVPDQPAVRTALQALG